MERRPQWPAVIESDVAGLVARPDGPSPARPTCEQMSGGSLIRRRAQERYSRSAASITLSLYVRLCNLQACPIECCGVDSMMIDLARRTIRHSLLLKAQRMPRPEPRAATERALGWADAASLTAAIVAWIALVLHYEYQVVWLGNYLVAEDALGLAGFAGIVVTQTTRWGAARVQSLRRDWCSRSGWSPSR